MKVFGPVPSRRLGQSLGINHIPHKLCTYNCVYCQLGREIHLTSDRQFLYDPYEFVVKIFEKVKKLKEQGERIDYLSFVPDGEPTLDMNLSKLIELLKPLNIKTAIITNASLIFESDVRESLLQFDWVSVKIDSVVENIWRKINRPDRSLKLDKILQGIIDFSQQYKGILTTETMLVSGINDIEDSLCKTSVFISELNPSVAYLSVPTRPPAEKWVNIPSEETLMRAYSIYSQHINNVELLTYQEVEGFVATDDFQKDFMAIISVHPISQKALDKMLEKYNVEYSTIEKLVSNGIVKIVEYSGQHFYILNFNYNSKQ